MTLEYDAMLRGERPIIKDAILNITEQILREKYNKKNDGHDPAWHILAKCANSARGTKKEKEQGKERKKQTKQENKPKAKTGLEYAKELLELWDHETYEYKVILEFIQYIVEKKDWHIISHGIAENGDQVDHDFGYPHRFTAQYIKARFAKLYKLDEWYQSNPDLKMTFITFTTPSVPDRQLHLDESSMVHGISDSFRRLQKGKRLLMREMLRDHNRHVRKGHKTGPLDYIMVVEPHKSGYPHYHMIVFDTFTVDETNRYRQLWEQWHMGSFYHGLDFDERPRSEKISSLRNYLMKYMAKSFIDYKTKYEHDPWNKEQLLFNAIAWKFGYRTWCASNHLSQVMSYHPEKDDTIDWQSTTLQTPISEFELWKKPENIHEHESELVIEKTDTAKGINMNEIINIDKEKTYDNREWTPKNQESFDNLLAVANYMKYSNAPEPGISYGNTEFRVTPNDKKKEHEQSYLKVK